MTAVDEDQIQRTVQARQDVLAESDVKPQPGGIYIALGGFFQNRIPLTLTRRDYFMCRTALGEDQCGQASTGFQRLKTWVNVRSQELGHCRENMRCMAAVQDNRLLTR